MMAPQSLKKAYRIGNIILSFITFVLTLLTLSQFIYVHNLYYFIICYLIHLGIILIYNGIFLYINKTQGYRIYKQKNKFISTMWIAIYCVRITSCCIILTMIHLGNLFIVEEVALSKNPFSITYMVFVFMLIFLEFFSIFLRFVEKSE